MPSSPALSICLGPQQRVGPQKTSIKLGCGSGPLAPSMRTVKSVAATRSMRSWTRRIASLEPIRGAAPSVEWCGGAAEPDPADGAFELQHGRRQLRGGLDQLTCPVVQRPRLLEVTSNRARPSPGPCPDVETHGVWRRSHALPPIVAQPHRARLQRAAQLLLQPFPRGARVGQGKTGRDSPSSARRCRAGGRRPDARSRAESPAARTMGPG